MTNISAIGYNLQALFNQVSTLNARIATLENKMLQAKEKEPVMNLSNLNDTIKRVLEATEIATKLTVLEQNYKEIEKDLSSIKADLQSIPPMTVQSVSTNEVPVIQEPEYPSNEIPTTNDQSLDDVILSVTPTAPKGAAPKGGRKKKAT